MQTWLTGLYARHGRRYVPVCLGIAAGEAMFALTPIASVVAGRYEGLSLQQFGVTLGASVPLLGLSLAGACLASRQQIRMVHAWSALRRTGLSAQEVAVAAHSLPRRLLFTAAVLGVLTAQPVGELTTLVQVHRVHPADFALLFVGGFFFAVWGVVVFWAWLELSMRTVIADASQTDPSADIVGRGRLRVTTKLTIALGSSLLVGACYAGALTAEPGEAFTGLWQLMAATVGVCVVFGLLLVPLFAALLLTPVRELTRSTRRVGRGDLDTRVPVASRDELGELAVSFNVMVDGLRERSQLRAHNTSLVAELRASRERIVTAGDAARRRVERDLHDGAQQQLVLARLKVGLLRRQLARGQDISAVAVEVEADIERALRDLRELAHGIYPAQLDEEGLPGALRYAVWHAAIPSELDCDGTRRYRPELEAAVYFSCTEALQNAAKYAGDGAHAWVRLGESDGALVFEVADDGRGFDTSVLRPTSGLQNISDRVGALGGTVQVESGPGRGTRLRGSVPLEQPSG